MQPGLIEARVTLAWDELATGRQGSLTAVRLFAWSTVSLESRHRLNWHGRGTIVGAWPQRQRARRTA